MSFHTFTILEDKICVYLCVYMCAFRVEWGGESENSLTERTKIRKEGKKRIVFLRQWSQCKSLRLCI